MTVLQDRLQALGLTQRQFQHWIRQGHIEAQGGGHPGVPYSLSAREWRVVERAAQCLKAGFTVEHACGVARQSVESNVNTVYLPGGITLVFASDAIDVV